MFLCDAVEPIIEPFMHHDDAVFIDELNAHTVKTMLHEMQQEKVHAGVLLHPDFDELKKAFFKKFTLLKAGGGLVENENGDWLLIHRRGKWDLPKGKLDPGETMEACALREVREETGLNGITSGPLLLITRHTYHEGTHFLLKETHWYKMQTSRQEKLVPQQEEDITDIKWVNPADLDPYIAESYASVADVLLHARG